MGSFGKCRSRQSDRQNKPRTHHCHQQRCLARREGSLLYLERPLELAQQSTEHLHQNDTGSVEQDDLEMKRSEAPSFLGQLKSGGQKRRNDRTN